ncbi:SH3 domain-containing protein [Mesorhizobium sp.]|uniref:SH3 domain-containing protein n=1 Tax=Mesorhizobium sp. TaxID=1871066 RepID=UPI003BAB1D35
MRRTVTLRTTLHALLAAPVLFTVLPAVAEELPLVISIVSGLAPDDLLNVRATASPIGRVQTRLPNGSSVKNLGCNDVNGHQWCKVEDVDNPKVTGWAPARYLIPTNPAPFADTAAPAVAADKPGQAPAGAPAAVATASDGAAPAAAGPLNQAANPPPAPQPPPAPPPDLAARLGSADHAAETAVNSAAAIGRAAMQDAYGLAFAAKDNPAEIHTPADPAAQAQGPAQTDDGQKPAPATADTQAADATPTATAADDPADDGAAPVTSAIPVPTPRPELAGAKPAANSKAPDPAAAPQAANPQTVAKLDPPASPARAPDATGEVPCARYVGQPMTRCEASIVRMGNNKADVTVTWPDGGTRVISFYDGLPAGSNSRSDFRFTREGGLSMIRVGVSERFEITDSLAFGD